MAAVYLELPAELVAAAKLDPGNVSQEAAKLIALELFRESMVSIGRRALLHSSGEIHGFCRSPRSPAPELRCRAVGRGPPYPHQTSDVTVVSDSSPLITLAKIGRLELLCQLYQIIAITPEVYHEVVIAGASLSGALEVAASKWIQVTPIRNRADLAGARLHFGLGLGEASALVLARELSAHLVLIDEIKARRAAQQYGLAVLGCVGVLEDAFGLHLLSDLARAYRDLLSAGAYVDRRILESSLKTLGLPPL